MCLLFVIYLFLIVDLSCTHTEEAWHRPFIIILLYIDGWLGVFVSDSIDSIIQFYCFPIIRSSNFSTMYSHIHMGTFVTI